jgi:SAM-dependent methyltransferase
MSGFYATIARYYDAEHTDRTDDLALYSELAEEYGGPALDVGCGTGRVLFHLAQEGHTVYGIDSEQAMLDRARRRLAAFPHLRARITIHQGDVLTWEPAAAFKLSLLSYNSLMHFHDQPQQLALLQRLRRWAAPDSALVIDLPNAGETFATQDSSALTLERTFIDTDTGHLVMQQAVSYLDRVQQLMHVTWIYDEITGEGMVQRTVAPVVFRYFFYPEVRLLLAQTGFEVAEVYGDSERSPFEDGCERMIVIARPV